MRANPTRFKQLSVRINRSRESLSEVIKRNSFEDSGQRGSIEGVRPDEEFLCDPGEERERGCGNSEGNGGGGRGVLEGVRTTCAVEGFCSFESPHFGGGVGGWVDVGRFGHDAEVD